MIQYGFLWHDHSLRGQDNDKDRPCAVVLSRPVEGAQVVMVAPITTKNPDDVRAIELPAGGRQGLAAKCWLIPWEVTVFHWITADVGHAPTPNGAFWRHGALTPDQLKQLVEGVKEAQQKGRLKRVRRSE